MKKIVLIIVMAIVVVVVGLGGWAYVQNRDANEAGEFIKGTVINGVDCSGLDVEQSAKKLTKVWNSKKYVIRKGDKKIASLSNFNFKYNIELRLGRCLDSEPLKKVFTYYGFSKNDKTVKMEIKKQTARFKKQIKKVKLPVKGKRIATENAYVDMSNRKFKIVPEVYGNTISKKALRKKVVKDIEQGIFKTEYNEKKYYKKPSIRKNNKKLRKRQKYCRKYLARYVVWNLGYTKITLSPQQMDNMISAKGGKISVNETAVSNYVNSMTFTAEQNYNRYKGTAGKALNVSKSVDGLISALASGKDATVKAVFTGGSVGPLDKKSTYVEIDISGQHLWLYSKGKVAFETPIVTGDVAHDDNTPTGTYHIYNKKSPAVLKGRNYDGSKYKSKVTYWMPFSGGIGLHDAPWKSVFGGTEYLNNGSHGCVNLPPGAASTIYSKVSIGTKVVVHQ